MGKITGNNNDFPTIKQVNDALADGGSSETPTDVFSIEVESTNFDLKGSTFGGVFVKNRYNYLFTDDYNSPFVFDGAYQASTILSFVQMTTCVKNANRKYYAVAPLIHYRDEALFQFKLILDSDILNSIKSSGYTYASFNIEADLYNKIVSNTLTVSIAPILFINMNISKASMSAGIQHHIRIRIKMTFMK